MTIQRTFTAKDQIAFAELSGDYNPAHLDDSAARRSLFGRTIVHGIHLVLWALDAAMDRRVANLKSIAVQFRNSLGVGDLASIVNGAETETSRSISIVSAGVTIATIRAKFSAEAAAFGAGVVATLSPPREQSLALSAQDIEGVSGAVELSFDGVALDRFFPTLSSKLPSGTIAVLLATTRIVGVYCPGLHSIFSELECTFDSPRSSELKYAVKSFDPRFGRAVIGIGGAAEGQIVAFLRPPPTVQPTYFEISQHNRQKDFAERRGLVIGGSRGIGEVLTKVLAARGADVRFTYHRGQSDAETIAAEIGKGNGRAVAYRLDVADPGNSFAEIFAGDWAPTHLYYMATPAIFVSKRRKFSADIYDQFCRYYVSGFSAAISACPARPLTGGCPAIC